MAKTTRLLLGGLVLLVSACGAGRAGPTSLSAPAASRPDGATYQVQQRRWPWPGTVRPFILRYDRVTEREIPRLNDQARSLNGSRGALDANPTLDGVARTYSRDLAAGVTNPKNPIERVRDMGIKLGLAYFYVRVTPPKENLAADIMKAPGTGWLNDPNTRPIFMHNQLTDIGVGAYRALNGMEYVTVVLVERTNRDAGGKGGSDGNPTPS